MAGQKPPRQDRQRRPNKGGGHMQKRKPQAKAASSGAAAERGGHKPVQKPAQKSPQRATQGAAPKVSRETASATARQVSATILETRPWDDYALVDMGAGQKLERYGPYRIVRPEPQAMGQPLLPQADWDKADAIFSGNTDEEGPGRWRYQTPLGETWPMAYRDIRFHGRFTSFRHVGVFPEQAAHWDWMIDRVSQSSRPLKVLNLFSYTGVASLLAAAAGAQVTHVDASKKAIGWARENQELSRLTEAPIRWICDDAVKFVAREKRRGNTYDGILLDPPKYGRGPKGEVWQLFDGLPDLLADCRDILSPNASFLILTAYSIRASFVALDMLMQDVMANRGGQVESGELVLKAETGGRYLSTSLFSRWQGGQG
ncbi:class I SAM-dependent methyltransferase [Coralliovum pocilloporae]|uniref:class I SAM-dependent methyltransferase n=1 Tax=Coralliovum pocilloporae TaxID=3066369 RepID=UPI0033078346